MNAVASSHAIEMGEPAARIGARAGVPEPLKSYVILLTTGSEDGGLRATMAFSLASTAIAMGRKTSVFLSGRGVHWSYEGHAEVVHLAGFPPLAELVDAFFEFGGQAAACSSCTTSCPLAFDTEGGVLRPRPEIQRRGMASLVDWMEEGHCISF